MTIKERLKHAMLPHKPRGMELVRLTSVVETLIEKNTKKLINKKNDIIKP